MVMVFSSPIPSFPATLGNFLVPLMIGARDLAFPLLNLASWYIFMIGGCFTVFVVIFGGAATGWTSFTPYMSSLSKIRVTQTLVGLFITGFDVLLTWLNLIGITHSIPALVLA